MNYSLRTMLVGIALILVGIYIQNDPGNDLYGNDFLFVITGFVLIIAGCFKNAIKKIIEKLP
ncbi:MAG: hypothetical protein ACQEXQ_06565 [Bacillota bacterium]